MLVSKTLGKFATVHLALRLELPQVFNADATVTTDTMEHDLPAIKKFVEMCAAHAKALCDLGRRESVRTVYDDGFVPVAHATAQA